MAKKKPPKLRLEGETHDGQVVPVTAELTIKCPFCPGTVYVARDDHGRMCLLHTDEGCKEYIDLSPDEFLFRVRSALNKTLN